MGVARGWHASCNGRVVCLASIKSVHKPTRNVKKCGLGRQAKESDAAQLNGRHPTFVGRRRSRAADRSGQRWQERPILAAEEKGLEQSLCVYSSSSDLVDPVFFTAAAALGEAIAGHGWTLVYGGTNVGLMGAVARAAHRCGGKVVGVIPQRIADAGIAYSDADELIVTREMRERKAMMETRSTAFVGLPGGFGTLEEIFEILTLKQLGYHAKAVAVLNVAGFYDPLVGLFEHIYQHRFAKPTYRELYHVAPDVPELFAYLEGYQPPQVVRKWS